MKFSYVAALILGASLAANAQGYKDGIEYYKAGQFDNAITILTRNMNAAETNKALANYYLGQAYLNKGDKAKAMSYFETGIAADPNCGYNYVGVGAVNLINGNKAAAEENFKKAQSLAKKNAEITVDIARAYYNADPVLYAKDIDKKLEQARKDSKSKEPAIYIFEGDREAKNRNFNQAATWYEQAILFDSDNPEGYVKYANTYFYQNPQYAIQRLQELLERQPNSALAQRELAEKYYENGNLTKAAAQYGQYMANPNHFPQDKARYAVLLYAGNEYENAMKTAQEVLKETPNDLTLERIIYRSLNDLGRTDQALEAATRFFNNPDFAGRYNSGDYIIYAQLLTANGQADKAEDILKQGRKQLPEDTSLMQVLADAQSKAGKSGEALETYDAYLKAVGTPSTQDYNNGSLYALTAVSETKDDAALRNKYAEMGLGYVDKILEATGPRVNYLLRKVQILLNRNLSTVDADSEAAIVNLLSVMDQEPSYSDPNNPDNSLNIYKLLYNLLSSYYDNTGNKEAADNARAQYQKYSELMQ